MTKKELFLLSIEDIVADLCYYDRKDDEELEVEDVRELIKSKEISLTEITDKLKQVFLENYPDMKQ